MSQAVETYKREAVELVLKRLGNENYAMLKENLLRDFKIDLASNELVLEELQIALQRMVGTNGAILLVREIRNEIALRVMG
jgi:hypothetical protein